MSVLDFRSMPAKKPRPGLCPFCGSADTGLQYVAIDIFPLKTRYFAHCFACGTRGPYAAQIQEALEKRKTHA